MKNINFLFKILSALLVIAFIGCEQGNDYVEPASFSDLAFTTTAGSSSARVSEVNQYMSFMDLSAGAITHTWTIPSNAFFLQGPIPSNLETHDQYIINSGDTVSTDKTVHVLWKVGDTLTKVKFMNVFVDSTSFILPAYWDYDLGETVYDTIRTERFGELWKAEYEITVDVYDTITPTIEIRDINGNVIDFQNMEQIDLKFEDQLIFEDLSRVVNTARPDQTKWRIHTIEENEDDEENIFNVTETKTIDTITFDKSLGQFTGELTASREGTEDLKSRSATIKMGVIFNISQLDEPLTYAGFPIESDEDVISLLLSHRIQPFSENVTGNFTIEVDGVAKTIESVTRNSSGTKLFITLDSPLIPQDDAKSVIISYDGENAALLSFDERQLEAFNDAEISVYVPQPVVQQGDINEIENQTIQLFFDSAFNPASLTDPTVGFEVLVNGISFDFASISVNASDAQILDITLADQIYSDDIISVSHDGTGDITSVGGGLIAPFSARTVTMYELDLLNGDGSFSDETKWHNRFGHTPGVDSDVTVVTPPVPNTPSTGTAIFIEAIDGKKADLRSEGSYPFETGKTYIFKAKRFITAEHTTTLAKLYIGEFQIKPDPEQYAGALVEQWEDIAYEFIYDGDTGGQIIRLQPIPVGVAKIYYDNMIVVESDKRP